MTVGRQRGRRADFAPYTASVFAPHLFSGAILGAFGCGASALALITGISPDLIAVKNGGPHYSDSFMISFLRKHGHRTLMLTPLKVCGAKGKIGSDHVVLMSQLFRRYEATWGVIHGNLFYHNFQSFDLSGLAFLNKPILSAYLVIHPRWRVSQAEGKPRNEISRAAGPRLKLNELRKHAKFTFRRKWA